MAVVSGCAKSAEDISAAYISPLEYQGYSCPQLQQEATRLSDHLTQESGQQDARATSDKVAMGVGVVIFWPALFFLKGNADGPEIARLKGQMAALEQANIQKNCGFRFAPQPGAVTSKQTSAPR